MKMTLELAAKIVKKLRPVNKQISNLNYGGCGVFAVALAKQLISLGFDAKIIGLEFSDSWAIDHAKKNYAHNCEKLHYGRVNNIKANDVGVETNNHYCVQVEDIYLDSTGYSLQDENGELYLTQEYCTIIGEVDLIDFEYISMVKNPKNLWNNDYDRTQNKEVISLINSLLNTLP